MIKSVSNFTKLAVVVAVAAGITACNQPKTDTKTSAPATATPEKAEIVYVNSDTLLNKYEYFKDMSTRLQDKGKAAQADLQSKGEAFQREVVEYQKTMNTLSADQRAQTEQRLKRKNDELQAYKENASAQLQNEQAGENNKLYDKIADFTKAYAKEKGYKLVLTFSKANPTVLYGDPSLDVTADVVKRLNEAYAKDKK
ncbi:outer membrane chaperone Skp [Mucilaginibacter sp. PPCGB 2223]|uniref:OmpH family outer membrane protein n=1 Tax=Mucilaginibacter sp. PPCGB 2223 TaxID=1886027 RepID=UPI000826589F|nr:OmpH family outer membrane protein [Mucilaginibacter sp. PPCGB 2223]OCX54526.1 outer membrane chaperone Skp [Mucilaginibacter sp. PPCGB 2223]